jgi:hypothetical protein
MSKHRLLIGEEPYLGRDEITQLFASVTLGRRGVFS